MVGRQRQSASAMPRRAGNVTSISTEQRKIVDKIGVLRPNGDGKLLSGGSLLHNAPMRRALAGGPQRTVAEGFVPDG